MITDVEAEILRLVGDGRVRLRRVCDGPLPPGARRLRRRRGQTDAALLGLLAYASIAGDYAAALPGAAAVELGHNFSLVHDDIEDGDIERRHRATCGTCTAVPQAINAGDMLFSLSRVALHRLTDLGFSDTKVLRLMRLYDRTCVALCEGQYIDIATSETDQLMSVDLYFDMIGRKTAALIAASIESGALLATDDEEVIGRYRAFGWDLGLAFQLNDDLLGIWGEEQLTGKEPTDIARKKKTLPVIYAFEHADPAAAHQALGALRLCRPRTRRGRRDRPHPRGRRRARLHAGRRAPHTVTLPSPRWMPPGWLTARPACTSARSSRRSSPRRLRTQLGHGHAREAAGSPLGPGRGNFR